MVGIVIGCILGLCPLLFIDQHAKELRAAFDKADKDGSNRWNENITFYCLSYTFRKPFFTLRAATQYYVNETVANFTNHS
jgi:hypothetical protein